MSRQSHYESGKVRYRFRELTTLAIFTFLAAFMSVMIMDVTVFPLTLFAVYNTVLFNSVIKYSILILVIALIMYPVIKRFISFKSNGIPTGAILVHMLKKTGYYFAVFFIFICITCVIIGLLYILMYNNHLLLHRLPATV